MTLQELQCEIKGLGQDSLPQVLEQKVTRNCSQILAEDLKAKIERQTYVGTQLETVLELLLELASCQEVLGGVIQHEVNRVGWANIRHIFNIRVMKIL
jgi:hypothetical protein